MLKLLGMATIAGVLFVASAATASAGHCGQSRYYYGGPPVTYRAAPTPSAPATAQAPAGGQTYRSFSYEPSEGMSPSPPAYQAPAPGYQAPRPAYQAPMMRGGRAPSYLLPKTDSRRFGHR